eukprot:NODE_758_length_1374_cov_360.732373.p1 GENE.NODE_758_length_1374_cov_360.732373~~NODE_758_length_1374_cov_360.732373.p1  ORF type:complete len:391 (+),score=107.22 NODE_758_length_1374_cov_360.732373:3-1175(+)
MGAQVIWVQGLKLLPRAHTVPRAMVCDEQRVRSRSPRRREREASAEKEAKPTLSGAAIANELRGLHAFVVNLDRRPDRWAKASAHLKKELPWLPFERFSASNPSVKPVPEHEVAAEWNTKRNAVYGDYWEYVYDAPDTPLHATPWKWVDDVKNLDEAEWKFVEDEDGEGGLAEKVSTKETFRVKHAFAQRYLVPGQVYRMSDGERGCAHSHRRIWEMAAGREQPTLVFEDDVGFIFERNGDLGMSNGAVFSERLALALKELSEGFDVLYLGWAGYRGGNFKVWEDEGTGDAVRSAEYVWTTVAYVISQAGARKLLALGPIDQPVDNFMAWESSQRRLNSYVALDAGDEDGTYAGGLVIQDDFMGDSDVQKSDGGIQGDNANDFVVEKSGG